MRTDIFQIQVFSPGCREGQDKWWHPSEQTCDSAPAQGGLPRASPRSLPPWPLPPVCSGCSKVWMNKFLLWTLPRKWPFTCAGAPPGPRTPEGWYSILCFAEVQKQALNELSVAVGSSVSRGKMGYGARRGQTSPSTKNVSISSPENK